MPRVFHCHLEWLVQLKPPISLFSPREKRNGPFTVQREKSVLLSLVENFGLVERKREVQIDLTLRLFPLPLLRWVKKTL